MFRLTWDGPDAQQKSLRPDRPPQVQRVYRWENKWGYLLTSNGEWLAESRTPVAHASSGETRYLLEAVEELNLEAPPFAVDDLWEEEVVLLGGGSMAAHSMSLVGSKEFLARFCKDHGIVLPPEISAAFR
jgi:hypothetical protein